MLEQRRPIRLHADSLDKGFDEAGNVLCALLTVAIADMSMIKCLRHIARSLMRVDPRLMRAKSRFHLKGARWHLSHDEGPRRHPRAARRRYAGPVAQQ